MSKRIKAINANRPKLKLGKTVGIKQISEYISSRTGLTKGNLLMVLAELSEAVQFFNKQGKGVKLDGLGIYAPKIGLDGKISVSNRLDKELLATLNKNKAFTGEIINKKNIGKTSGELIALWNQNHPDDPVEE